MNRIPPIKAVMTAFPHSIEVDRSVAEASDLMARLEVRHLPVVREGELVGVLTDRDVRLVLDPSIRTSPDVDLRVQDVCGSEAYVVDRNEPLDIVLRTMAQRHAGSALVVRQGKLVGIFTLTDACLRFSELLRTLFPSGPGEDAA